MTNKKVFNEALLKHYEMLKQYIPIVNRVHGKNHPEFNNVKLTFEKISNLIESNGSNLPMLNEEFATLREITNNYTIPHNVCESYAAVYNMLKAVDKAYHS